MNLSTLGLAFGARFLQATQDFFFGGLPADQGQATRQEDQGTAGVSIAPDAGVVGTRDAIKPEVASSKRRKRSSAAVSPGIEAKRPAKRTKAPPAPGKDWASSKNTMSVDAQALSVQRSSPSEKPTGEKPPCFVQTLLQIEQDRREKKFIGVMPRYDGEDTLVGWEARVRLKKIYHILGKFTTQEEAAVARDNFCREHEMQVVMNFPKTKAESEKKEKHDARKTSSYRGVGFVRGSKKKPWRAGISYHRRRHNLGSFDTEIAAATAYDAKARELMSKDPLYKPQLNFPRD